MSFLNVSRFLRPFLPVYFTLYYRAINPAGRISHTVTLIVRLYVESLPRTTLLNIKPRKIVKGVISRLFLLSLLVFCLLFSSSSVSPFHFAAQLIFMLARGKIL